MVRWTTPSTPRKVREESAPRTPRTRSPEVSPNQGTSPPHSPALFEYEGKTLDTLCDLTIDWCTLIIVVQGVPKTSVPKTLKTLRVLLRHEGVQYTKVYENKKNTEFYWRSLRIRTAGDMRRLMCKLPGRLTHVMREAPF